MKTLFILFISAISILNSTACENNKEEENQTQNSMETSNDTQKITITIDSQKFKGELVDSPTTAAFKELLPLTISMTELNGNEKYYDLSKSLPTSASNPRTIQSGDLMLYGSKTLVLFYESFNTSYSYTKLGSIDNPSGLAEALGSGNVTVTFEAL